MFGIVFGTLCLVGLAVVLARGRRGFGHGYRRRGYGWGPRAALNEVLARLDTAPGQEKVIVAAVEELFDRAREAGRDVRDTRRDLARALRGEQLDEQGLTGVFARHDAALEALRASGVETLRKVHAALDERQRKLLGDLVDSGAFGYGFSHHRHGC